MYYIDNSIDVVHKEDLIKFNELLGFYKKIVDRKRNKVNGALIFLLKTNNHYRLILHILTLCYLFYALFLYLK